MKMLRKLILIILLLSSVVNTLHIPITLSQPEKEYYINLSLNKEYGFIGQTFIVNYTSNYDNMFLKIIDPSGVIIYNKYVQPNGSKTIPIQSGLEYGIYKIRGEAGNYTTETWFSIVSDNDWDVVSIPYSRIHNNMNVTFYGNWTVTITEPMGSSMNIDFSSFRELNNLFNMDIIVRKNDNFFLVRARKGLYMYDLSFMFYHRGIKWAWNGSIDQPRTLEINVPKTKLREYKDELTSGNFIHDLGDLRKSGIDFSYSNGKLYINAETSFYIDPVIFVSDLESGSLAGDNWTGNTTTDQGVIDVNTTAKYQGDYGIFTYSDSGGDYAYAYKDFSAETTVYYQFMVYIESTSGTNQIYFGGIGTDRQAGWIGITSSLNLTLYYADNYSPLIKTSNTQMNLDTWYNVTIMRLRDTTIGKHRVWLDGVNITDLAVSGINTDPHENNHVRIGNMRNWRGATILYHDNFELSDKPFTSDDIIAPTYSNPNTNTTLISEPCRFQVTLEDETALDYFIFGTNNTGMWINETAVDISGLSYLMNVTKTLNETIEIRVEWEVWFNDTSNNWNSTGIQYLITTIPVEAYFNIESLSWSTEVYDTWCNFSVYLETDSTPSHYWLEHNSSGSMENETAKEWNVNGTYIFQIALPDVIGYPLAIRMNGNTTDINNSTSLYILTTVETDMWNELLFGDGFWFGLIIIEAVLFIISSMSRLGGFFSGAMATLMFIVYYQNITANTFEYWGMILMGITAFLHILIGISEN